MRVAELEGALLDYWVAKAEGLIVDGIRHGGVVIGTTPDRYVYHPSTNWAHGGPIIERNLPAIGWNGYGLSFKPSINGSTPLIAAMRSYVASKYGDEVPDMEIV